MNRLAASLIISLSFLAFSANAGTINKIPRTCFSTKDRNNQPIVGYVVINGNYVSLSYADAKGKSLGGYNGLVINSSLIKFIGDTVVVDKVTLNDGFDGWVTDAKIVVTKETVTIKDKTEKRIKCPAERPQDL